MSRFGRYAPAIGLIVGLVPAMAHAQTNIDEGKTPAQIFASDCNVCHKAPRGLAAGRTAGGIADYLRQHYTTGREQAASLAAYILGAGGNERGKPAERAGKPAEENGKPSIRQARRPPKGEEPPGRAATLQQPKSEEETKSGDEPIAVEEPGTKPNERPARGRRGEKPGAANKRGRHPPPAEPAHETPTASVSSPVAAEPAPSAPPAVTAPATAAAPAAPAPPAETSPIPRDDIPD